MLRDTAQSFIMIAISILVLLFVIKSGNSIVVPLDFEKYFCLNNGTVIYIGELDIICECLPPYYSLRCELKYLEQNYHPDSEDMAPLHVQLANIAKQRKRIKIRRQNLLQETSDILDENVVMRVRQKRLLTIIDGMRSFHFFRDSPKLNMFLEKRRAILRKINEYDAQVAANKTRREKLQLQIPRATKRLAGLNARLKRLMQKNQ